MYRKRSRDGAAAPNPLNFVPPVVTNTGYFDVNSNQLMMYIYNALYLAKLKKYSGPKARDPSHALLTIVRRRERPVCRSASRAPLSDGCGLARHGVPLRHAFAP